jgi:hypothetical protein
MDVLRYAGRRVASAACDEAQIETDHSSRPNTRSAKISMVVFPRDVVDNDGNRWGRRDDSGGPRCLAPRCRAWAKETGPAL